MDSRDPGCTEYGQRLGPQILALGLLSSSDIGALISTFTRQLSMSEDVQCFPHGRWLHFHEVRTDFVQAARSHLDGSP
jgi:hypothetical protein